ncbi:hypothetical protein NL676_037450 [Syzygium grande]|nr:hypothetical protein NL676_037450 [Syzygium grande]
MNRSRTQVLSRQLDLCQPVGGNPPARCAESVRSLLSSPPQSFITRHPRTICTDFEFTSGLAPTTAPEPLISEQIEVAKEAKKVSVGPRLLEIFDESPFTIRLRRRRRKKERRRKYEGSIRSWTYRSKISDD